MNLKQCKENFKKEHYQWVADDLTRLIKVNQYNAEFYKIRGDCYERLFQWDKAIEDYTKAIEIDHNYQSAYNDRGILYENLKQYNRALSDYNKALQLNRQAHKTYNNRGLLYQKLMKNDLALEDYNQAIKHNKTYYQAYNNRALIYEKMGQNDKALQDYAQAIKLNGDYFKAYNNRGLLHEKMNHIEDAIKDYNQALRINPHSEVIYRNRGISHLKLSHKNSHLDQSKREGVTLAIEDYTEAINKNPKFDAAYYSRGNLYKNQHRYQEAINDYTKVIELNHQHDASYCNRGIIFSTLYKYNQAITDFNMALKINPKNDLAYYNRGNTYKRWNKYHIAEADYLKALQISPENPLTLLNLGKCYYLMEQQQRLQKEKSLAEKREQKPIQKKQNSNLQKAEKNLSFKKMLQQKQSQKSKEYFSRGIQCYNRLSEQQKKRIGMSDSNLNFLKQTISTYQQNAANLQVSAILVKAVHQDEDYVIQQNQDIQVMQDQLTVQQKKYLTKTLFEKILKMSEKVKASQKVLQKIASLSKETQREYYTNLYSILINHFLVYRVSCTEFFNEQGRLVCTTDGILEKMCEQNALMHRMPFLSNLVGISFQTSTIYQSQASYIGQQTSKINEIISDKLKSSTFFSTEGQITQFLANFIQKLIENQQYNSELIKALEDEEPSYLNRIKARINDISNEVLKIFWRKQKKPSFTQKVVALQMALLSLKFYEITAEEFNTILKQNKLFYDTVLTAILPKKEQPKVVAQKPKEKGFFDYLCCWSQRTERKVVV